jgi:hypothetical protein
MENGCEGSQNLTLKERSQPGLGHTFAFNASVKWSAEDSDCRPDQNKAEDINRQLCLHKQMSVLRPLSM